MKKFQESAAGKLFAVVMLVCMVFTSAVFSIKACQALPFLNAESYRDTEAFYLLLHERLSDVARAFAINEELQDESLDYVTRRQLEDELSQLRSSAERDVSNLRFKVRDEAGELIYNLEHAGDVCDGSVHYASFVLGEHGLSQISLYEDRYGYYYTDNDETPRAVGGTLPPTYTIECTVIAEEQLLSGAVKDGFYQLCTHYHTVNDNFVYWAGIALLSAAAALVWLLWILWTAGHKAGVEEIVLTWQEKIFFDVYLCVMALAGTLVLALGFVMAEELVYNQNGYLLYHEQYKELWFLHVVGIAALCVAFVGIATLTLRTFVVRLKARCLARSTLTCRMLMWCWRSVCWLWDGVKTFVRSLPFLWRIIAVCLMYFFANVMLLQAGRYNGFAGFLWFALNLGALLILCWWSMGFQRLRKGSRAIAAGNLSHQIETKRLPEDLRQHAEDLNNISGGLQNAVNEQMKSERFKAELITNVSHDLKTPLTSIINYVDLLKTTDQTDPKAEEYIEVLDRKAQRLKKLTEDLVEASKASTGTLNVNREKIGMSQLVGQALGEYEEKLQNRNLTVITSLPEEETYVYADGRHLWRVIDNLLSNCCKYAMEGTRVYLELVRGKGQVILSVKNISREPLNVPAERLMERFVRGEESRSTEGSGLGLSIARSLTELQGGTFDLAVDGDLFKAIVTMPQAG